jgi:YD repeat-containing protein
MMYDSSGRPGASVSAFGATTRYTYGTASGSWYQAQTTDASQAKTTTTLDGMGRAVRVATLAGAVVQSYVDTVYAPCPCSPLGKISKVSQPYAPGQTPAWTVYTYDGMGRTLAVQQPDGASRTTYSYSGNQSTVTDPAGNWKQFTTDVLNNLVTVVEPDPSSTSGGTLTTSYTYDWMNHVTQVSMPRAGTTKTRSFIYDNAGRLTAATNPENGTVSYGKSSGGRKKADKKTSKNLHVRPGFFLKNLAV